MQGNFFLSFRNPFGFCSQFCQSFRMWVVALFWINFTHSLKRKSKPSGSQTFLIILNLTVLESPAIHGTW